MQPMAGRLQPLDVRPATAMVQVAALIDPDMLVEIEADAVISS